MPLTKDVVATYLKVPVSRIDDAKFNQFLDLYNTKKTGTAGDLVNKIKEGAYNTAAAAAETVGAHETAAGFVRDAGAVPKDPDLERRVGKLVDPTSSFQDTLYNAITDPKATGAVLAQSLPASAASLAAALPAGRFAKGAGLAAQRIAGTGVFGGVSGAVEYGNTVLQTLSDAGVDISSGEKIAKVMEDPEVTQWLREKALSRGVPIGAFDAITYGLAGKIMAASPSKIAGGVGETAMQMAGGAGGEAAAQLADTGKITNENALTLEALMEGVTGVPEAMLTNLHPSADVGPTDMPVIETAPPKTKVETVPPDRTVPPSTFLDKNKTKIKAIDAGRQPGGERATVNASFPRETVRGTYKQITDRLGRLQRQELIKRAKINDMHTDEELKTMTKKEIAESIAAKYGIRPTTTEVQTPSMPDTGRDPSLATQERSSSPKVETPVTPPVAPKQEAVLQEGLADDGVRAALEQLSKGEGRTAEAARAWLNMQKAQEAEKPAPSPIQFNVDKNNINFSNPRGNWEEKAKKDAETNYKKGVKISGPVTAATKTPVDIPVELLNDMPGAQGEENFRDSVESKKHIKQLDPNNYPPILVGINHRGEPFIMDGNHRSAAAKRQGWPTIKGDIRYFAGGENSTYSTLTPKEIKKEIEQIIPKEATGSVPRSDPTAARPPSLQVPRSSVTPPPTDTVWGAVDTGPQYEYLDKFRGTEDGILEFTARNPDFKYGDGDWKNANQLNFLGEIQRSYDMFRSMQSVVRRYPFMAPLNLLWRDKQAFRHQLSQMGTRDLHTIAKKFGEKRFSKALEILDTMSRPGQEAQSLRPRDDGRIMFKDVDGKTKLVDKDTSNAILAVDASMKKYLMAHMQMLMAELSQYGIDAQNGTREQVQAKLDEYTALGDNKKAAAIQSTLTTLDRLHNLVSGHNAYFPHVRSDGPYAIATYTQNEDGGYDLVGLYDVKANALGKIDGRHLDEVQARIQEDQKRSGKKWYTSQGKDVSSAVPFYKTRAEMMNRIMRNAKDTRLVYEAVSSLLSTKGVDPKVVNEMFDSLSLREDAEKTFVNLRERKGYYGYNNADRISVMANHFLTQSAMLSNFRYNPKIRSEYATVDQHLTEQNFGDKIKPTLNKYYDYLTQPGEDANWIRKFNFWYFLAGNPSTSLLQVFSTYTNTLPWMTQYVGPGEFAALNAKSVGNWNMIRKIHQNRFLLHSESLDRFARMTGMPISDAKTLLRLKNEGILDPGYGIEAVGDVEMNAFGAQATKDRRTPKPVRSALKWASNIITVPEEWARLNSALLVMDSLKNPKNFDRASKLLMEKDPLFKKTVESKYGGKPTKEAIIRHAIDENHAVFGKVGRAQFMRGTLGTIAFPFLTYPIQIMEQLGRLMIDRGPEGRKAFLMMALVYPALFGGVMAVPGYELWDWATKWYKKLADKERTDLEVMLSRALQEMGVDDSANRRMILSGPLFDGLGVSASTRIASQFWFQPLLDLIANPEEGTRASQPSYDMMGGFGSVLNSLKAASGQIKEGENPLVAGATNLLPTAAKNVIKAYNLTQGDLENMRGRRILEDDTQFSVNDVLNQGLGFTPQIVSQARRYRYGQQMLNDAFKDATTQFNAQLSRYAADMIVAKQRGDGAAYVEAKNKAREVLKQLVEFNNALPAENRKTLKKLYSDADKVVTQRVKEDINPLGRRQSVGKKREGSKDANTLALPLIEERLK